VTVWRVAANKKEGAKIMKKTNTPSVKRIRVSLQDKVALLLKNKQGTEVTFVREDGSKIIQTLNDTFLIGKRINEIVDDLHAINHDLRAKYFII